MSSGWVKIHRELQNHWIWEDKPFSRGQAWVDLIMMATYKDKKMMLDGKLSEISCGNIVTSIRKLCSRWGWSNTKVRRFLKMLEDDGMIAQKSDTKKTLITLVNYGFYQDSEKEKTTQKHHRNDTETTQKHTYKKEKKDKKEKNNHIHNFQQREYDFEDLEQRLLEKQFKPE